MSRDGATEEEDDYMSADYEDGYMSDSFSTDYDDDDLEDMIHFELLKVSAEDFKSLPSEERVRWLTAHFIIQKNHYMFEPRNGEELKEEQVSKVVVEEDDDNLEEESKMNDDDDDGGSGSRGASWKPHAS